MKMGKVESASSKTSRKRPISCHFCRSRKLRCSRQNPCTNCESRGIKCSLYPTNAVELPGSGANARAPMQETARSGSNSELMARILRIEEIVLNHNGHASGRTPPVHRPWQSSSLTSFIPPPDGGITSRIEADILRRVSFNEDWFTSISPINVCFKICSVKNVPQSPTYLWPNPGRTASFQEPIRCVWLPLHEEAKKLFEKYVRDVTFIHHVIHTPTVRSLIDDVYDKLAQDQPVLPGQVALLMSIFGGASYAWTFHDADSSMFLKPEDAHSQSTMWVRSCLDLLDHCRRSSIRSFEALQATVITFFMLVNLEGITVRYSSMVSQAICMAREIGLHRLDHPNEATNEYAPKSGSIMEEIGRRIWWYLCATDWMISRYTGPQEGSYSINLRHMATRKPWNVDDEELFNGMQNLDKPISQPTEMSYFLQRIRLGEMCRELVDRTPLVTTSIGNNENETHADVLAVDSHFIRFLDDLPDFFKLDVSEKYVDHSVTRRPRRRQQQSGTTLTAGIIVQRYILQSLLHSHRCKMHLPYLAKASSNPQYSYSREACLEAARQTVRTERLLEREAVQFVHTRFRIAGVLQAVFVSCIAFLLDMCFHNDRGQCDPKRRAELLDACGILEDASHHSPMTANLLESLNNIVQKYNLSLPRLTSLSTGPPPTQNQSLPSTTEKPKAPKPSLGGGGTLETETELTRSSFENPISHSTTSLDLEASGVEELQVEAEEEAFDWDAFNGMEIDGVDWNAFLSELDSQFVTSSF